MWELIDWMGGPMMAVLALFSMFAGLGLVNSLRLAWRRQRFLKQQGRR